MVEVWVGLGSNLGDRLQTFGRALDELTRVRWAALSPVYESDPKYLADQPPFLNAVARGETELGPNALLEMLKQAEQRLGRQTRERNGPRELDLDLLLYGGLTYRRGERLIVPHPRIAERRFVLQPLADLWPDLQVPGTGRVGELLCRTEDPPDSVRLYAHAELPVRSR